MVRVSHSREIWQRPEGSQLCPHGVCKLEEHSRNRDQKVHFGVEKHTRRDGRTDGQCNRLEPTGQVT